MSLYCIDEPALASWISAQLPGDPSDSITLGRDIHRAVIDALCSEGLLTRSDGAPLARDEITMVALDRRQMHVRARWSADAAPVEALIDTWAFVPVMRSFASEFLRQETLQIAGFLNSSIDARRAAASARAIAAARESRPRSLAGALARRPSHPPVAG